MLVREMQLRLIWSYKKHHLDADYVHVVTPAMYEKYASQFTPQEIEEFGKKLAAQQKKRHARLFPDDKKRIFHANVSFFSRHSSFLQVALPFHSKY